MLEMRFGEEHVWKNNTYENAHVWERVEPSETNVAEPQDACKRANAGADTGIMNEGQTSVRP